MPYISCAVIAIFLGIGCYTDWKSRKIPNYVSLTIVLCGFFTAIPLAVKISSFTIMALALLLAAKMTGLHSGGGDIKLYLSLSFAIGLFSVMLCLILTLFLRKAWLTVHKQKDIAGRFPICCYLAPAYLLWYVISIVIEGSII